MMLIAKIRVVLSFVGQCAVVAAVGFAQGLPVACAEELPPVVRIATSAYVSYGQGGKVVGGNILTTRIIQEKWLEARLNERGVQLEWFPITGDLGPVTNEAFAGNRIDFANIGDLPSIILNAAGVRTQLIVPNGRGSDLFLIVPLDSTAKSIKDLKGKRVSVQASRPWELGFRKLAQENNLKFTDFRIFNLDPNASMAALAKGNVDAYFSTNGHLVEEKKIGKIIWSSKGALDHKIRSSELWAAKSFVDKYPELTQIVATAYVRAQHWTSQDENREAAIVEGTRNGTPASVVRKNFEDSAVSWRDRWSPLYDPLVTHYYRDASAFAYTHKIIGRKLNADELFQPKFLDAALTQLNLTQYWKPSPVKATTPAKARSSTPYKAFAQPNDFAQPKRI